jgi:hypothetical protein
VVTGSVPYYAQPMLRFEMVKIDKRLELKK